MTVGEAVGLGVAVGDGLGVTVGAGVGVVPGFGAPEVDFKVENSMPIK